MGDKRRAEREVQKECEQAAGKAAAQQFAEER